MEQNVRFSLEILMLKDLLRMNTIDQALYDMAEEKICNGMQIDNVPMAGVA